MKKILSLILAGSMLVMTFATGVTADEIDDVAVQESIMVETTVADLQSVTELIQEDETDVNAAVPAEATDAAAVPEAEAGITDNGDIDLTEIPVGSPREDHINKVGDEWYAYKADGTLIKNATPVINGKKYYCSSTGVLKSGWLYLGKWKMYFSPEDYAAAVGFSEIDGKMYLFNKDGVMQNYAGTTEIEVDGTTGKYWFSTDDASLKTGWLSLGSLKLYFDSETYAAYNNEVRKIDDEWYAFNKDGVLITNATPVINGSKYYCGSDGTLQSGWLYLGLWKMYFDPETMAAATGFKEIGGKMYLFDANGVMQNYAGTTNITVNGETNKYWFSTDDASLKTGWLSLGSMKLYFDPETYAAYVSTTVEIEGVTYVFDGNGVASAA